MGLGLVKVKVNSSNLYTLDYFISVYFLDLDLNDKRCVCLKTNVMLTLNKTWVLHKLIYAIKYLNRILKKINTKYYIQRSSEQLSLDNTRSLLPRSLLHTGR